MTEWRERWERTEQERQEHGQDRRRDELPPDRPTVNPVRGGGAARSGGGGSRGQPGDLDARHVGEDTRVHANHRLVQVQDESPVRVLGRERRIVALQGVHVGFDRRRGLGQCSMDGAERGADRLGAAGLVVGHVFAPVGSSGSRTARSASKATISVKAWAIAMRNTTSARSVASEMTR
jgi:hypothetical protein